MRLQEHEEKHLAGCSSDEPEMDGKTIRKGEGLLPRVQIRAQMQTIVFENCSNLHLAGASREQV